MRRIIAAGAIGVAASMVVVLLADPLQGQGTAGGSRPSSPAATAPLVPDTVLTPPGSPRIVRLPAPGSGVVSLRLSIPVTEAPVEAGTGRILQMLGTDRAASLGRPVGASVEGTRTPWGIAYTVSGAAADIDFLAFLLREATRDPTGRRIELRQAVAALETEARRRQETPGGRVVAQLRSAVAPAVPPLGGTLGSLRRLTMADIRAVWARTHAPGTMTVVVAGDVPLEVLLASFQRLGAPADGGGGPVPADAAVAEPGPANVQVIRHWYGEARPVGGPADPHGEIAALLVAEQLRDGDGPFEADVRLLQLPEVRMLAVVGAAYAAGRQQMRSRIQSVLRETAESLTPAMVERAVAIVEADVRMRARTPSGRAALVGLHLEAAGEVGAARDFLAALETVTVESTRGFLARLADEPARAAEVRP